MMTIRDRLYGTIQAIIFNKLYSKVKRKVSLVTRELRLREASDWTMMAAEFEAGYKFMDSLKNSTDDYMHSINFNKIKIYAAC